VVLNNIDNFFDQFDQVVEYTTTYFGWPGFASTVYILMTVVSGIHHVGYRFTIRDFNDFSLSMAYAIYLQVLIYARL
jgi:hypothetical protein